MPRFTEIKYKVDSFKGVLRILVASNSRHGLEIKSTHYYAKNTDNEIVKLVDYSGKFEIHILNDNDGRYTLKQKFQVDSELSGKKWLAQKGFTDFDIIKMAYTEYEYKTGVVGLYLINNKLKSVILDFPTELHKKVEKELGLDHNNIIMVPYNKLLFPS